jgi:Sugar (and other) transporter
VKKGREQEARNILAKYHANGKDDDELVEYEYREILEALQEEETNFQTKYTDYLKGPGNRRRLLIIMVVSLGTNWVGNGIIGYYLAPILKTLGITSTDQQLQILIGLQVWNCKSQSVLSGEKSSNV